MILLNDSVYGVVYLPQRTYKIQHCLDALISHLIKCQKQINGLDSDEKYNKKVAHIDFGHPFIEFK